jgi:hypothetical protein
VPDPNRASDLEKLRQRALLREFACYVEGRGRVGFDAISPHNPILAIRSKLGYNGQPDGH